jgi:hypothetical protein
MGTGYLVMASLRGAETRGKAGPDVLDEVEQSLAEVYM